MKQPGPVGAAINAAARTLPALATALGVPVPHGPRHGEDGWQLVAYDREWLRDVALLTYEHPRRGTVEVMRGLCSGRVVL